MADWLEIAIAVGADVADDVAGLLPGRVPGADQGVEIRAAEIVFWVPVERGEEVLAGARAAIAALAAGGLPVDPTGVIARPAAPEAEWRDAWKRYFHVIRLTRQIVIVPSWETYAPGGDDLVIDLDPGQAFGTGAHASTQLCLEELQGLADEGAAAARLLDVGTGSGILAIAAARLWPGATGLAVDSDPIAVTTAAENCALNRVAARVECAGTGLGEIAERFDLVLANIQADVLLALRDTLAGRVAPGGRLILSGLLRDQVDGVAAAYAEGGGLVVEHTRTSSRDPEWGVARLLRPSA